MRAALSVFWRSLQYWGDEIVLLMQMNAAWVVANLLIIPGPPATAAMMVVTNRIAHGELVSWRVAREAFRRYFWKAWGWGAINLVVVGMLVYNLSFYQKQVSGVTWTVVQVAWAAVLLIWGTVQFYWFPLLLEMPGNPLIPSLQNAAKMILLNPLFTLVLVVLTLLLVALGVGLVVPATLMLTSILALIANHATLDRLAVYREWRAGLEEPEPAESALAGIDRPARPPAVTARPPRRSPRRARRRSEGKKSTRR
jgi:uncharacterized membrane protein YesL